MRFVLLPLALLLTAGPGAAQTMQECTAMVPTMWSRSGDTVQLSTDGVRFAVPVEWRQWGHRCGTSIRLGTAQTAAVESSEAEWEREYAAVLNAVFPISEAIAHAGGEGWGEGALFRDLHVRLYLSPRPPEEIHERLRISGRHAAEQLARGEVSLDSEQTEAQWLRSQLRFELFFQDYGGPAVVEVYSRHCEGNTLSIVLLYSPSFWSGSPVLGEILTSVRCSGSPPALDPEAEVDRSSGMQNLRGLT